MFNLNFPAQDSESLDLQLEPGQILFVLGANGSGKSSLIHHFFVQNLNNSKKISAHRQTWMRHDALDLTPVAKISTEMNLKSEDKQLNSLYRDNYAGERARITIFELINAENNLSRKIADAYRDNNLQVADEFAKKDPPIATINTLLERSNIPIEIKIRSNERLMASKNGGPEFSAVQLSDGERNSLLIAGDVLTAPKNSLLIIDEPERHLHRSIISPLLTELLHQRQDCAFVVSTHDHNLPVDNLDAQILLLWSCDYSAANNKFKWKADKLDSGIEVDDVLKRDLLGARRKILFVEGTENSLDRNLYSLIFPMASVIPKGSCYDVERSVVGLRAGNQFHWLEAFGIVDGDAKDAVTDKGEDGIYELPYYSVESIFFHSRIIEEVAKIQASVHGFDEIQLAKQAISAGLGSIEKDIERLSKNAAKKKNRQRIMKQLPNDDELLNQKEVKILLDGPEILSTINKELEIAIENENWDEVLIKIPLRSSSARSEISKTLKFPKIHDYENAVVNLLRENIELREFIENQFGDLAKKIQE